MKAGVFAIAIAAIASGVNAKRHLGRHAHEAFHMERALNATAAPSTCGCTTIYTTITGEGTLYFPPPATSSVAPSSSAAPVTTSSIVVPSSSPPPVVPTPLATTCPTPGVYTIPATTVTLTSSTTVCAATSTSVLAGTYTVGGVTTVVSTATTVICPYATVSTSSGVITSTILTTTYVCPSAGTYTIAPLTTTCVSSTVVVYPTPASYAPGTYTQPQVVTTITETDYVVFCPFTSPAPVAPASTSPAYVAPASTTPAPASTSPAYVAPAASTTVAAPAKSSTPATPSGPSSSGLGSSGNQWAITYSPYNSDGTCRATDSVASDIAMIAAKGFSTVRIYSTDCSGLANVGNACAASGLKMILGVFISSTGCSGAAQQITDIVAWGKWSLVELIVIGNEAIFSGYASGSDMVSFISSSKATFQAAGYTGPCTTTEPLNILQENSNVLCAVMDIVGCNIHPFFNSDVDASSAGSFVASQLVIVDGICAGKTGINLETGWPSSGTCNGVACPGTSEQATAVKGIQDAAGGKSVMFSFVNDMWKDPGSFDCEQSWGVIELF